MESVFIYLLKSSGLIAVFFLAYHFLVRKETFFNSNRWFLLSGLLTSLLLPLFFIKKIILVEKPKIAAEDLVAYSQVSAKTLQNIPVVEAFDWMQFIWISYIVIALVLVIKIVFNFTSLYRMLYQQHIVKKEEFKLINLNENIAPFSFFNYIVFNSDLYTNEELQSILLHEKIHSQQKHSIDVLVAKLFCIVFWFNPFVWLYKKAITQNLEYIADQKAIEQLEDKKSYQRALLKVVSHQSCLSITNNFYQSLIKKRIVMLNTNQSHKRNSWKYALIIPALIGFVLLFQIKVIAQERNTKTISSSSSSEEVRVDINKNSTDQELKNDAKNIKKYGVTLKCSKIKRNSKGEITGIKVEFKDENGSKGVSHVDGDKPIEPIHFYKSDKMVGFGKPKGTKIISNNGSVYINASGGEGGSYSYNSNDSIPEISNYSFHFDVPDVAEAPELPELPEVPEYAEQPEENEITTRTTSRNSETIIKEDGKKPVVIINGKVVKGSEGLSKKEIDELENTYKVNVDENETQIFVNRKNASKIRSEALANARVQVNRMRPIMLAQAKKNRERARQEMEKARPELERAREEMERSRPDMDKARAEMIQAKEEMIQAKEEMLKAKAELEKERAELKKQVPAK